MAWQVLASAPMSRSLMWPVVAGLLSACIVGGEAAPSDDDPIPPSARGLVSEPTHGAVLVGDPGEISLRVAGVYDTADTDLAVQALADPDDLASWETIATARSAASGDGDRFAFSTDVTPGAQAARWPAGGVLRLRVVDAGGAGLPYDAATPADTVLAVVNPAAAPAAWTYLTEQPVGSPAETLEYYAAIDAPATLDEFIARFGFPGDETSAVYYNAGDLGIGREMHCRAAGGGLACYVRNFGVFGGSRSDAIAQLEAAGTPLATVAMIYTPPITAPNAVQFMVYGGNGALITEAQLDSKGNNISVPQNCLNCHGGRSSYDAAANAVLGARFLPFDPAAFAYSARPEFSFAAQEDKFRQLNRLVAAAAPAPAVRDVIDGMFPEGGAAYNPAWAPAAWRANPSDERVYHAAIAPFCRGCHVSFAGSDADPLALADPARLRSATAALLPLLCGTTARGMPAAEQTALQYFESPARAVLLSWLNVPGACAPPL